MTFLPGTDRIAEEVLELIGLAQTFFVNRKVQGHLPTYRYLDRAFEENGKRLIIEKLLCIAIKIRFLDEHAGLLKSNDRANSGHVFEDGVQNPVGLRKALNKLIHHRWIYFDSATQTVTVANQGTAIKQGELLIPEGQYAGFKLQVRAGGTEANKEWEFQTDINILANEIFRVFYFDNWTKENPPQ